MIEVRWKLGIPLTVEETASLTGIAKSTLYNWRAQGRVEVVVGEDGRPRFTKAEILRMLGARECGEPAMEESRDGEYHKAGSQPLQGGVASSILFLGSRGHAGGHVFLHSRK